MSRERKPSVRWVLPDGQYNPVVGEGVRWLDYESAADPDADPGTHTDSKLGPDTGSSADSGSKPGTAAARPPFGADGGAGSGSGGGPGAVPLKAQESWATLEGGHAPDGFWLGDLGGEFGEFGEFAQPGELGRSVEPVGSVGSVEPVGPVGPGGSAGSAGSVGLVETVDPLGSRDSGKARAAREPGETALADDWFDLPERPPRLADCRPYGVRGGLAQPDPQVERDLAEALSPGVRFPDPRGTWIRLVNGGGPADDPFRASNAADCALAVLSTWHGEPATAAPRLPEYDRIGRPALTGERGSVHRIEQWVGQRLQYLGQGRHAYPIIARRLLDAGHGASAVIVVRWPGGGSHAWNAVNSGGEVIWIDAQRGHMSVEPPYTTVTGVFCVILDRRGRPR
ncbi:toxin glutamine deamidase domain-containing protein [Nonomuraea zeae]|uniref:toxin glutamine deamidase domain-containing protein n=1 Tax=Nonomuraea zeae TaxID=1642303 RepID=UPI001F0CFB34|nr:toxin glutamine deamidase domain-containing protein [Nonomuraea zeae]